MTFDRDEYMKKHYENQKVQLKGAGFDVENLTQNQIDIILQPDEAPENYACDGEITPKQAFASWRQKLKNSGLTQLQIHKATKYIFG